MILEITKKKLSNYSIFKIGGIDAISNKTTANSINFTLPNTVKPQDFEAFFLLKDSFYLFSKSNNFSQLFKVSNTEGNQVAEFISEYKFTSKNNKITSADISDDGKTVVLLTHDKIWKLNQFKGDDFFSGKIESQKFNHDSQKEGVCFKDNNTLIITEEGNRGLHANIYKYTLD